jgi:hypothetical protein
MKKLKFTAAMLAAMLSFGVMTVSAEVTADEEEVVDDVYIYGDYYDEAVYYYPQGTSVSDVSDVDLKTALTKVKNRIKVPEALSEFEYNVSTYSGVTSYNFTWYNPDDNTVYPEPLAEGTSVKTRMRATIVGDIITSVSMNFNRNYGDDGMQRRFGKISPTNYESYAKKAVELVNPGMSSHLKFSSMIATLYGEDVDCSLIRVENGVEVASNTGRVSFDKDTGELLSFNISWWDGATFKSPKTKVDTATIEKNFESSIKLDPYYVISRDYQTKKTSSEIVFFPSDNYEFDAFTGKKTTMYEDMEELAKTMPVSGGYSYYGNSMDYAESEAAVADDADFTAAELREIAESEVRYSRDEAVELVKAEKYLLFTDEYKLASSRLRTDNSFGPEKNYWTLSFEIRADKKYSMIYVVLDADSGKIESFSQSGSSDEFYVPNGNELPVEDGVGEGSAPASHGASTASPMLNVTKINTIAKEAAEHFYGDIFDEYKADKNNTKALSKDLKTGKPVNEYSRDIKFNRYYKNIPVADEFIIVTVNCYEEVVEIRKNHTEGVSFPEPNILTTEKAFDKLWEQTDFNLYYSGFTAGGKPYTYLMYHMNGFYMNARTGNLCSWSGGELDDPIVDVDYNYNYSDINSLGTLKAMIQELGYYGIALEPTGGKFSPNSSITGKEFYQLMSVVGRNYSSSDFDELHKSTKPITNAQAAKMFVIMNGAKDIAELEGIYSSIYTDVPASNENIGYINIATALGLKLTDGKQFKPDSYVTRKTAITLLFGFLDK